MSEIVWYFKFDEMTKKVARPYPWVDPKCIEEFSAMVQSKLSRMGQSLGVLQSLGFLLKISEKAVTAFHEEYNEPVELDRVLREAGIPRGEVTMVFQGAIGLHNEGAD